MSIIHRGATGAAVRSFPPYRGYGAGYHSFICQMDTGGGHKGAEVVIEQGHDLIEIGHTLIWIKDNILKYSGIVSENDNGKITLVGTVYEELSRNFHWTGTLAIGDTGTNEFLQAPGRCASSRVSTNTAGIGTSSYALAATIDLSAVHALDILETINKYEGWHWGGFFGPGMSLSEKPMVFFWPPDRATLNWIVDGRTLAQEPDPTPDFENFANYVTCFYNGGANQVGVIGTQASRDKYGTHNNKTNNDIGSNTSSVDATRLVNVILDGSKVDGIESPPVTAELVLDAGSRLRYVGRSASAPAIARSSDMWGILPGDNILVTGRKMPRLLSGVDQESYFQVSTVRYDEGKGQVSAGVKNSYDPAVVLARMA